MPFIVVSFQAPHRISTCYCDEQGFLGYSKAHLRNRTVQMFHGAKTDADRLSSVIEKSAENKPLVARFELYDACGECRTVMLNISAFCGLGGTPVACKISIESFLIKVTENPAKK